MDELDPRFPPVNEALDDPDGLLAIGGHLNTPTLLRAYRLGIFPWFEDPQPILWWSPSQRAVLIPGREHVSRTMAKLIRQQQYRLTSNQCFATVMEQCAAPRAKARGTWITTAMKSAYLDLHQKGHAHSVECWRDDRLVGGLYGVQVGGIFCGESMFSLEDNSSKLAFIALSRVLATGGFHLIDCQLENPHLISLGVKMISREFFSQILAKYSAQDIHWPDSEAFQKCLYSIND